MKNETDFGDAITSLATSLTRLFSGTMGPHPKIVTIEKPSETYFSTLVGDFHGYVNLKSGYRLSIIRTPASYGYDNGLFEIAIKLGDKIVYDTGLTSDVIGNCTPKDVMKVIAKARKLKPAKQ